MEKAGNPTRRVLIVEDDPDAYVLLERELQRVDSALLLLRVKTGEEAVTELSRARFELVISDVNLDGEMTGLDLCTHCRENYPQTSFLLTSGIDLDRTLRMVGWSQPRPDFLPKPFRNDQCHEMLTRLLSTSK